MLKCKLKLRLSFHNSVFVGSCSLFI